MVKQKKVKSKSKFVEEKEEPTTAINSWGNKRKNFYGTDYVDKDFGGINNEEEEEVLRFEEEDAISRQKKLDLANACVDLSMFDCEGPNELVEDDIKETSLPLKQRLLKLKNKEIKTKMVKFKQPEKSDEESPNENELSDIQEEEEPEEKRKITYEMQANKGIILKKRRKDQRHARIKKRKQYHKALIRRRSQVPDIKYEISRYEGEKRGIRASTVRSIKL